MTVQSLMNARPNRLLSIVIPSFNEAARLPHTLMSLYQWASSRTDPVEIIVSDDGSTDATSELPWSEYSHSMNVIYIHSARNRGKGAALRSGLARANGSIILFTDADLPLKLEELDDLVSLVELEKCDIVIGNRRLRKSTRIGISSIGRRIISKIFNLWVQLVAIPSCSDTQFPLKIFRHDALQAILPLLTSSSLVIDVDILLAARHVGVNVSEVPITYYDTRRSMSVFSMACVLASAMMETAVLRIKYFCRSIRSDSDGRKL